MFPCTAKKSKGATALPRDFVVDHMVSCHGCDAIRVYRAFLCNSPDEGFQKAFKDILDGKVKSPLII